MSGPAGGRAHIVLRDAPFGAGLEIAIYDAAAVGGLPLVEADIDERKAALPAEHLVKFLARRARARARAAEGFSHD